MGSDANSPGSRLEHFKWILASVATWRSEEGGGDDKYCSHFRISDNGEMNRAMLFGLCFLMTHKIKVWQRVVCRFCRYAVLVFWVEWADACH